MVARQLDSRLRGEQTFANRAPRPLQLHHVSCRARAASNGRRASGWQSIGWGGLVAYAGLPGVGYGAQSRLPFKALRPHT